MKNLDYKWLIIIGLGIALTITIILSLRSTNSSENKYEAKIAILNDSIHQIQGHLDIYKLDQQELQKQNYVREEVIKNQKILINKLKKKFNEEEDSVYTLDNQHTIEFLSKWLSQRTN